MLIISNLSLTLSPTSAALQSTKTISLQGTIYHPSWNKTVTWADGTTETLQVTTDGKVYLNGVRTIAFGFHIVILNDHDDAKVARMLDTIQSWGVRFMSFDLESWFTEADLRSHIDYWFPKLYARKFFVEYAMQEAPTSTLNLTTQKARFTSMVNLMNNPKWASMIYSATYGWELDLPQLNRTDAQIDTYLKEMTPFVKNLLRNSLIGGVPLMTKMVSPEGPYGSEMMFRYCDFPGYDYYTIPSQMPQHAIERFNVFRQHNNENGRSNQQIWLQENGVQTQVGGNWAPYTPEQFQFVLNGAGQGDVSELMIWCMMWDDNVYNFSAFDCYTGLPRSWILALVPYFP